MTSQSPLPDPSTPFGECVHRRLRDDRLIWLITVGSDGTPQANPVWFLWEGETVLVYNVASAHRLRHVRERPRVSLHVDGVGEGVVVIAGRAWIDAAHPPADEHPAFLTKYGGLMGKGPQAWARRFPVAIRIRPLSVRGHVAGGRLRSGVVPLS